MTARRRATATVAVTTLALAGLATAVPASAATQVCAGPTVPGGSSGFCIDSVTTSPASVPNNVDATVSVTVHVSSGSPACLSVSPPYGINAVGSDQPFALTRQGTSATWTGTYTSRAFMNDPGTYPWVQIATCNANYIGFVDLYSLADHGTGVAQPLVVTGISDTTAPVVRSLSVTPASQDATTGDVTFAVTARVTDDYAGASSAGLSATPAAVTSTIPGDRSGPTSVQLTRTAGTALDGTWTGSLRVSGGTSTTWSLSLGLRDTTFNERYPTTADLAAGGMTSKLTTRTTAAPPTPTGLKAVTSYVALGGYYTVKFTGAAPAAGKPAATAWLVTAGSGCGGQTSATPGAAEMLRFGGAKLCTFSVVAVNEVGKSKAATAVAVI